MCTFTTEFDCTGEWTASTPCLGTNPCGPPVGDANCVYCTYDDSRDGQLPSTANANSSDHCKLLAENNGGSEYSFHYDAGGIDASDPIRTTPCVGYCFSQIPGTDETILPFGNPTNPPITNPLGLNWFDIVKRSGTQHVNSYGFLYRKGENWSSDKTDWSFDYIGVPVLGLSSKLDAAAMDSLGAVLSSKITRTTPIGLPAPDNLAGDGTPLTRHILTGPGVDKPDWIGDSYKLNSSSTCPCHDDFWRCDIPRLSWDPTDDTEYTEGDECCQQKLYEWAESIHVYAESPYHNDFGLYNNCPSVDDVGGCPDAGYYLSGLTGYAWGEWDGVGCEFKARFDDTGVPDSYNNQILGCMGISNSVFGMEDIADMVMEMPPGGPTEPHLAGWIGAQGEPEYAWEALGCVVGCEPQRYDSSCVVSKNAHYPIPFVVYSDQSDLNEKTQVYRWDGPDEYAPNNRYYTVCDPAKLCAWGGDCPEGTTNCGGNSLNPGPVVEGCKGPGENPATCPLGEFSFNYATYSQQDRIVLLKMTLAQVEDMFGSAMDWDLISRDITTNFRGDDPGGYRCDSNEDDCDHIMYGYVDTDSNEGDMINSTEILIAGLNANLMTTESLTVEDSVYYDSGCVGTHRADSDEFHDPNGDGTISQCFPLEYYTNPNDSNGEDWPMFTIAIGLPNCNGGGGTAFSMVILGGVLPPPEIPCVLCDEPEWTPTIVPPHCCVSEDCGDDGCSTGPSSPGTGGSTWIPPTDILPQQQPGSHHRTPSEINDIRDKYVAGGDK